MAPDRRTAERLHDAAFKKGKGAGDKIHHEAHPRPSGSTRGRYPHYQADKRRELSARMRD